jgi:hypothetical protein
MDFAILVGSCDKYDHLWDKFYYLFDKYWDHSIDVPKYIITQDKDPNLNGFTNIQTHNDNFTYGLKFSLDQISNKNILWLQDDYFLRQNISHTQFKRYYDFFTDNSIDRFGIHDDSELYSTIVMQSNPVICRYHQNSLYTVSLQASLWNIDFLRSCLLQDKDETPWELEVDGSIRLNQEKEHNIWFAVQNKPWYLEACRKGNFTEDYYNICREEGIECTQNHCQ